MTLLLRAAGVTMLGIAVVACSADFTALVKEDGGWKLADCNILFGF